MSKGLRKKIVTNPSPLIDYENKLVLLWTPKSGCSFAIKWFFFQIGHYKAANDFSNWIHHYRIQVFQKSKYNQFARKDFCLNPQKYNFIKVTRNPYERAVSSYVHFLKMVNENHNAVKEILGENFSTKDEISFEVFVNKLLDIDTTLCDVHWRQQLHPLEIWLKSRKVSPRIIDLNDSLAGFKSIEQEFSLKESNLLKMKTSSHHTKKTSTFDKNNFVGDKPFSASIANRLPSKRQFYNDSLQEKIYNIYKCDFESYNYVKKHK